MAKMTRTQAVAAVADKTKMTKKDVVAVMDAIHELAVKEVKKNGIFVLGEFGRLVKAKRAARMGRNPATGAAIKIPAKTVVKFRLSKGLKDALLK
jgi:DNA-binding protein HU-beta